MEPNEVTNKTTEPATDETSLENEISPEQAETIAGGVRE